MIDYKEHEAVLEVCNRVTAGNWEASYDEDIPDDVRVCNIEEGRCVCCLALMGNYNREKEEWEQGDIEQWRNDAEFIALARTALPYWVKMAEELRKENIKLREELKKFSTTE